MSNWKKGGYETNRYVIMKRNGKPVDPRADYFVLRIDKDPHARVAAMAYADSVEKDNGKFADGIRRAVKQYNAMAELLAAQPQKGDSDE